MSSIELIDHVRRLESEVSRLQGELDAANSEIDTLKSGGDAATARGKIDSMSAEVTDDNPYRLPIHCQLL